MPDGHDLDCDQQHKPRQACNSNLAPGSDGSAQPDAVIVSPPEPPAPTAAPPPNPQPILASSIVIDDEVMIDEGEPRAAVATEQMPAPSPWASRAWEDTAAAVGATATPAQPPLDAPVDPWGDDFDVEETRGHAALVVVAIVVLAIVFILIRRRGRHSREAV